MIEKYQIVRDKENDLLTIKEFAILEKVYVSGDFPTYAEEDFSLRCKENYTQRHKYLRIKMIPILN